MIFFNVKLPRVSLISLALLLVAVQLLTLTEQVEACGDKKGKGGKWGKKEKGKKAKAVKAVMSSGPMVASGSSAGSSLVLGKMVEHFAPKVIDKFREVKRYGSAVVHAHHDRPDQGQLYHHQQLPLQNQYVQPPTYNPHYAPQLDLHRSSHTQHLPYGGEIPQEYRYDHYPPAPVRSIYNDPMRHSLPRPQSYPAPQGSNYNSYIPDEDHYIAPVGDYVPHYSTTDTLRRRYDLH